MTSTAITGTTAADLQNLLRDRLQAKIKHSFVELIPEELFNGMLDAAMDEFLHGPRSKRFKTTHEYLSANDERNTTGRSGYCTFETPYVDDKYNVYADPNTLPGMVYAQLVTMAKDNLKAMLANDPRFKEEWNMDTQQMVMPIINEIIGDNAQAFMRALMGGIVGAAMISTVNAIRNDNGMGSYCPPPMRPPHL